MLSFVYLGKRLTKKIKPHPEEIESYAWIPVKKAARETPNPFARARGLRDYLKTILIRLGTQSDKPYNLPTKD